MNDQAKISLTIHGMSLEVVGSEQFVSQQIGHFRDAIQAALAKKAQAEEELREPPSEPPAAPHKDTTGEPKYTNVLHVEGNKVRILKTIPGSTTSKKAVDTVVIYLWAKRNAGVNSIPFSELRKVCREQSCLDESNFASTIKAARQWIIVEGGRKSETAELTTPGVKHAETILQKLDADIGAQNS